MQVIFSEQAVGDLWSIFKYIETHYSPDKAIYVIGRIEEVCGSLTENPERGAYPKELLSLGIKEFREVFFKPYRILYFVQEDKVVVSLVADDRRDMQSVLQRRLLGM